MLEFFSIGPDSKFMLMSFFSMQHFFSLKKAFAICFLAAGLTFFVPSSIIAQDGDETSEAIKFFNQGQDAHEKGDLKTAVEFYQKALKIIPEFPEAEYQLGAAYLDLKQPVDAEKSFRRALELREDWSLPMAALGGLLVQKNQFEEAEQLLLKALELDESSSAALTALTELRLKTKSAPSVLNQLLEKLRLLTSKARPTAASLVARASLERVLGDKAAAKTSLARALALEPANRAALAEKAELALAENDFDGALETSKTLSKLAPDSLHAKFLLARALAAVGQTSEALKIIDAIENPPAEMTDFRNRIVANSAQSAAELEKQLAGDSKNPALLGRLCALFRTENPLKALDYCRRASEADPSNLDYVIGFGAALVQAKQFENAVSIFRKIITIAPDNFTAHANLAVALFQLRRYPEAKTEYLWLMEKQPELAVTYYFLGIIHDQLKEYLDAMANYQQFLKLADAEKNKLEIEKVNLRLPALQKQIKSKNKD